MAGGLLKSAAFNRTFKELKQIKTTSILIKTPETFNRTFKELKLRNCSHNDHSCSSFNRTFKELKHIRFMCSPDQEFTFNRTFKELKR